MKKEIIGMYQFTYRDLFMRPDIYPWVANVYIDEKYRNNGFRNKIYNTSKSCKKMIFKNKKFR